MQHVVGDVEDPESDDEDGHCAWLERFGHVVAGFVAYVGGEADEDDGDGDAAGAGGDEGASPAEGGLAVVTVVADDGLDQHAGDWAAEPDVGGPFVGDAEELDVRGE